MYMTNSIDGTKGTAEPLYKLLYRKALKELPKKKYGDSEQRKTLQEKIKH